MRLVGGAIFYDTLCEPFLFKPILLCALASLGDAQVEFDEGNEGHEGHEGSKGHEGSEGPEGPECLPNSVIQILFSKIYPQPWALNGVIETCRGSANIQLYQTPGQRSTAHNTI